MKKQQSLDDIYNLLIKCPVQSKEYKESLEKIRRMETGGHTLGLNLALKPVQTSSGIVEYNISKVL